MHHHQQVLINVCGTRMIPQPKMSDVFMDLAADAVPFRDGKAHQGMAVGAQNILAKCSEPLSKVYSLTAPIRVSRLCKKRANEPKTAEKNYLDNFSERFGQILSKFQDFANY